MQKSQPEDTELSLIFYESESSGHTRSTLDIPLQGQDEKPHSLAADNTCRPAAPAGLRGATGKRHSPTVRTTCAPRRRRRARALAALERHPAARAEACSRVPLGAGLAAPPAAQPAPLSGCTRPSPRTKNTKWLPAAPSRDPFVPFGLPNSAGPGDKWPGSAGGLRGGPAGPRRPGVEAGGGGVEARPATESRRRGEDGGHFVWAGCSAAAAGSGGSGAWRWVGQGS